MTNDGNQSTVSRAEQLRRRWALALCFLCAVLEGIDLQSMGVAAPGLAAEYGFKAGLLGLLGSASSLGLFFGALLGGVLSDRFGRRPVLITAVILFGVFSVVTGLVPDPSALVAVRTVTGLGLGAGLPMIIAIAAEAAPEKRRAATVTMMYCATPTGGIIAGAVAAWAAPDWRLIFYTGGVLPLLLLIPMYLRLHDANREDTRTGAAAPVGIGTALFGEGRGMPSVLLWVSFFGSVLVLYLLLNWLPMLLIGRGYTRAQANVVQIWLNAGGALGALGLGTTLLRVGHRAVLLVAFLCCALALVALAQVRGDMGMAAAAGFAAGAFSQGEVFVIYGLAASYYPTLMRGTGVGWAVAFGRLGAIAGPLLAGQLIAAGRSASQVLLGILPVLLIAGAAVQWLLSYPYEGKKQ